MTDESLAARVATARALVEGCVRDGGADLSAADQANLQETLEFLAEVGAALSAAGTGREDAGGDAETTLADPGSTDDYLDADRPETDGADDPDADEPGAGVLERHDEAGVIFEDDDPNNEHAWIAAAPDSIELLRNWR